jgi:hypothetical protein
MTEYKYKDEVFTTGTDWIKTDADKAEVVKGEIKKTCRDITQVFDILMEGFQEGAYEHSDITNLFADFLEDTLVSHELPEADRVKIKAAAHAALALADIKLPYVSPEAQAEQNTGSCAI